MGNEGGRQLAQNLVERAERAEAENARMRAALETLQQWDMLSLAADGHGAATADAPWARALIAKALNG